MRTIKLYTYWRDEQLQCCCPPQNKCLKDKQCEQISFTYDEYEDAKNCMSNQRVYKKVKGRIREVK